MNFFNLPIFYKNTLYLNQAYMKVMVDHKTVFKEENTTPWNEGANMNLEYAGWGDYKQADAKIRKLFVRTWEF